MQVCQISLPSLVLLGEGELEGGMVRAVSEAVHQATPSAPLVLHLPRVEVRAGAAGRAVRYPRASACTVRP